MTPSRSGNSRRLIVISYHFPSDGAVGGLRWAGLTKYLARSGWDCWVVTAAPAPDHAEPGVSVVSLPRATTLNERLLRFRDAWRGRDQAGSPVRPDPSQGSPNGVVPKAGLTRQFRQELGYLLAVPDDARGWVMRAAWRARQLIRRVRPDAVVSSGPPHSAHAAGWLATYGSKVPWFVDLRDPWTWPVAEAWKDYPRFRSKVFRATNRWLEWVAFRSARSVISNTRELAEALRQQHRGLRVEWVPNSVDPESLPVPNEEPLDGLSIVYVGTLYGGRDLTPILHGLGRFLERQPEAAGATTRVRIAGVIEPELLAALRRSAAAVGLDGRIDVLGQIPRDQALRLVARSQVAIVLAQQQQWQVPAKLYEMVGLGTSTIVVAEEASAAHSEARRLGAVAVSPLEVDAIADALAHAWRPMMSRIAPAARRVPSYGYGDVAREVAELLCDERSRATIDRSNR